MTLTIAPRFAAILFDFDGVLIESEYAGNLQIAETLTRLGYPTTAQQSMTHFMGLAANEFLEAVAHWIGGPIPDSGIAQDASPPIDSKKVEAIRSLIAAGHYPIDSRAIAAKMVALDAPAPHNA